MSHAPVRFGRKSAFEFRKKRAFFRDAPEPRYERIFDVVVRPLPISLEEGTRDRLIKAGKRLFGERGYHETNIHDITGGLGLAVGRATTGALARSSTSFAFQVVRAATGYPPLL